MESRPRCHPMISSFSSRTTCYWPDERELAETLLPFRPVTPVDIVRRIARLDLSQVLLMTARGIQSGVQDGDDAPHRIVYVFGTVPGSTRGIPDPAPPEPVFVIVFQQPGEGGAEPRLDRGVYRSGIRDSSEQRITYGNWSFHATLPGPRHVHVTGNLDKHDIEAIGRAILEVPER